MNAKAKGTGPTPADKAGVQAHDVIDRLYEVAVDPIRYEDLLDQWETMISPYRCAQEYETPISFSAIDFETHFSRASRLLDRIDSAQPFANGTEQGLLAPFERSAAFTIRRDLTIGTCNPPAMATLGLGPGDPLDRLPLDRGETDALRDQVQRMLDANTDTPGMFRARIDAKTRLIVIQLRVIRPEYGAPFVVAVTSELIWPDGFNAFLKSVFDLTEAETEILRALSECHSIRDIAETRGRSVETVRAQIKSLQAKTETRSQSELVRLTLSTMDMATFTQDAASHAPGESKGFKTLEPRPFETLTLRDGRRFDYLTLGDPDGRPCLFGPQDYGLTRWPASAEAEATHRGIKVIVPVRAGFGASTPLPRDAVLADVISDDYAQLLDHLGIARLPLISLGGDFFFSVHFHARHPDRVSALIACAGILPLTRAAQYERMQKWHRFILAGARYTPHLLPFMVKAGFALARKLGKRAFLHAVYGNCPADIDTFEDPEVFEAMVVGSEVSLSRTHIAHAAFSAEVIEQETTDWRPAVEFARDRVPVHFLNGLKDPQTHRDTLHELMQDYPWIEYSTYEDAGQLIFFLHWRDVLDILEKHL